MDGTRCSTTGTALAAGAALGTVAGVAARRRATGPALGPALRSTARVSFACFAAGLATGDPERRRQATLAMAGAHAVHNVLVATYLFRGRPDTGPGRLPTVVELTGGAAGELALAVMAVQAGRRRSGWPSDLATTYLAGLFAADFANEALRKGPAGRRDGGVCLAALALATGVAVRGRLRPRRGGPLPR